MDTTEVYIKMVNCPEIQGARVKSNGDFEVRLKHDRGMVEVYHHREMTAHYKGADHLWLPTQSQLQKMVLEPPNTLCPDILTMLRLFSVFVAVNQQFTSMEQLWLAFVLWELYKKKWSDGKWVKADE